MPKDESHPPVRRDGAYWKNKYSVKKRRPMPAGQKLRKAWGTSIWKQKRQEDAKFRDGKGLQLQLNNDCLHIIHNTLTEAQGLHRQDATEDTRADDPLPVEITRLHKWRQNSADADAEKRSVELQECVTAIATSHLITNRNVGSGKQRKRAVIRSCYQ